MTLKTVAEKKEPERAKMAETEMPVTYHSTADMETRALTNVLPELVK